MKTQRLLVVLTAFNLALLVFLLAQANLAPAQGAAAQVLRGRGLEIVDDRGRLRASISVLPADPNVKMPDGTTGYPETVLLRLINAQGRPNIKIAATEIGSGLLVAGESDPAHVQILAEGGRTTIKLSNKDGTQRSLTP